MIAHAWDFQEPATSWYLHRCSQRFTPSEPWHIWNDHDVHTHWLQKKGCEVLDKEMVLSLLLAREDLV